MPNFPFRVVILCGWLAACAAAPVQEMSDARQSIESAVAVGANEYTNAAMHEAVRLMGLAQQALEAHRYRHARNLALQAKTKAISARILVQQDALFPESTRVE